MLLLLCAVAFPSLRQPLMRSLLAVLASAILSTGLAMVVYFKLLATVGSIAMSSQAYLRIVVGVGLGIAFLGERPTASMWLGLWFWPGWHYRFRWLLAAYLGLVVTFAVMLMVPHLVVMLAAEIVLGLAIGLIYYSSLFYSMDMNDTKDEHSGIHEAAIGLKNCIGPAVGAASLHFLPQSANSGAVAVSVLLLCGLGGLLGIWRTTKSY